MDKIPLEDDENEIEVFEEEFYDELNFEKFKRDEGHIYEDFRDSLDVEEVIRELPEFDPTDDLFVDLDDSRGG